MVSYLRAGYHDAKKRAPSARQVRDSGLVKIVGQIHAVNYARVGWVKYGTLMIRRGIVIGREQTL
ncbi:hypothetical protein [Arcanobacterium phocae]|uniref:hypothetical protein n=1 Tax=Arcanobacterium phocae TaxID=131112 RepID=UPI001C0F2C12|nr:hypothetical protein [Arcanobacterium phocae]